MKIGILNGYDPVTDNYSLSEYMPKPAYQFKSALDEDYYDITSAESWDKLGLNIKDYIFVRYEIQLILIPKANPNYPTIDFSGWDNLSNVEKEIMARYILAPYALRLTIYSDEQDNENWFKLLDITQGTISEKYTGRALIIENMRKHVANNVRCERMSMATTQKFYKDVFTMVQWYVASATPDFKCWLMNEVGSAYENNGFAQTTYYDVTLRDELWDIYNDN